MEPPPLFEQDLLQQVNDPLMPRWRGERKYRDE
jgi:hypothetical protein